MPTIDSHVHLWEVARGDYGWLTPALSSLYRDFGRADLEPLLDAAGIDGILLVQAAPSEAETRYLLNWAARWRRVAGVVGWVDMAGAEAPRRIAALAADPCLKGIRPMIHDIADPEWMLGPDLRPALEAIVQRDIAFDCLVRPAHLQPLRRLLDRHPDLRAVIDHGAKPEIAAGHFDPWAHEMRILARETAVHCKLSGLVTEAGPDWSVDRMRRYIDHLVDIFAPDRLLWGSDWPVVTLAASYADWWTAAHRCLEGVDRAGRDQIFGGAAARFYRCDARERRQSSLPRAH